MGCIKKVLGSPITRIVGDIAATVTGNPELIPLIHGGSTLAGGGSIGDAAKDAGLAFAGQELLPVAGNAFRSLAPETASSLGITGGANSLSDLLGQTTGGGSWAGPGTIGGDIAGIASGGASGNSTMLSRLLSGSGLSSGADAAVSDLGGNGGFTPSNLSIASPSASGVTGDIAKGVAGNSPAFSSLASPALSPGAGGGASAYGGAPSLFGGGSSYGGANTLSALLGGASSLSANDKAQKALLNAQQGAITQLQPYLSSGAASNTKLSELLGTGGNKGAGDYGALAKPFTPSDLQSDPGYQFQLTQGEQALGRQEAARGNYFSGGALKAAQDYGQGLAGTTYNNAFQRNLAQKGQTYGMYSGQAGAGQQAAGAAGNIYDNIGNARANAGISSSNILNQTLSSLLSGSGAKRPINVGGQVVYV